VAPNGKLQQIGKCLEDLGRKSFGVGKNFGFKIPRVFGENGQLPPKKLIFAFPKSQSIQRPATKKPEEPFGVRLV